MIVKMYFTGYGLSTMVFLLNLTSSCHGQVETNPPKQKASEPNAIPSFLPELDPPVEDPYYVKTNDTTSTQGPQSITRNILQDRNGTFWFATWQGILSYDGKEFTNHTLKEDLIKFHVFSLLEDKTGNLWFGTIRGGLYKYDGQTFTLFTTADGLADNMVLCMMQDRTGNIWFGTDNGVSRYDPSAHAESGDKMFTNFSTKDGLSGPSVNSIIQDKNGKIWFGTRGGEQSDVCYFDGKSFTLFKREDGTSFSNVRSIIEDKDGIIWIGGQDGLFRYDQTSSSKATTNSLEVLTTNFIGYIFEDKKGNIWLSRGVVNNSDMTLTLYDGKSFADIKRDRQIFGIIEDNVGKIWFGSVDGVYQYDPE